MIDHGFIDNAKTHIHAGSKLTATSAHATFYLRNGDLVHSAQTLAHSMKVTELEVAFSIAIGGELENVRNVVMRDKKVWISAFENHHGKAIVVLELGNQPNQLLIQLWCYNVDGWIVDRHRRNAPGDADRKKLIVVGHAFPSVESS